MSTLKLETSCPDCETPMILDSTEFSLSDVFVASINVEFSIKVTCSWCGRWYYAIPYTPKRPEFTVTTE